MKIGTLDEWIERQLAGRSNDRRLASKIDPGNKGKKLGNSAPLAELSKMARREIVSDQYLCRLFKNRIDGYMDVKMKAAGDE